MTEHRTETISQHWEDATRILATLTPRERAHWREEIPARIYSHLLQAYAATPLWVEELTLTYLQAHLEPHPDHPLSLVVQASLDPRASRPTIQHSKQGSRGEFPIPRSSQTLVMSTQEASFLQQWRLTLIVRYLDLLSMALEQQTFEVRRAAGSGKR